MIPSDPYLRRILVRGQQDERLREAAAERLVRLAAGRATRGRGSGLADRFMLRPALRGRRRPARSGRGATVRPGPLGPPPALHS